MAELEEMYRRYGLLVERRCARMLGSRAEGRDASHETFARAARKLRSFRGEGDRLAWLYRISTNICLNLIRDRHARDADWIDQVNDAHPGPGSDEERIAIAREWAMRLLEQAGDDLTRSLVVSVYIDEMSQGEAAAALGISRATANLRLGRFRQRAQAALVGGGPS